MPFVRSRAVRLQRAAVAIGCTAGIAVFLSAQPGAGMTAAAQRNATAAATTAIAARRLSVHENVTAHLVSHRGTRVLNESGTGSGTVRCSVTTELVTSYTNAIVTFTCNTRSGSLTGRGNTSFYASGAFAYFKGPLAIIRGSGTYRHASARTLSINGSLRREGYALSAVVSGELLY